MLLGGNKSNEQFVYLELDFILLHFHLEVVSRFFERKNAHSNELRY